VEIRPLTLDDAQAWAALLATCFDRLPDDMIRLLTWLHAGCPVIAWGAWDGNRLIAQYACLLAELHLPQHAVVRVGMSLNMAVHPDYRGRGLVKHVSHPVYQTVVEQGGIAGVGFSNAEGIQVDRHSKSYGYQVVGKLVPTLALLRPRSKPALTLSDTWPITPFCDFADAGDVHFLVKPQHRFAQHPFRRYQYAIWHEAGQVCGIVIYRHVSLSGLPAVALLAAYSVDLGELLARWVATMHSSGVAFAHVLTTPHSHLREALSRVAACIPLPYSRSPYYLTVKPLDSSLSPALLDFSSWDAVGGDIL
jgi:GNAT superfamily N-acetyltransferase